MKENMLSVSRGLAELVSAAKGSVLRIGGWHPMPASGVMWSKDGVVVTAGRVHERGDLEVGMPDSSTLPCSLVGSDPSTGISVIKIDASSLKVPDWSDPGSLEVGNLILALGRPGRSARASLGILGALGESWTTPGGARLDRYIQPDLALPPGFAGGLSSTWRGVSSGSTAPPS